MNFSIIVPSFNQDLFIADTLQNLVALKEEAAKRGILVEVLVFDSESNQKVQEIILRFQSKLDLVVVKKDLGQYDAINKGLSILKGEYWTWLNTDDLLDMEGFFKMTEILKERPQIDYIFGGVLYIDEEGRAIKEYKAFPLDFQTLVARNPAIFQPGSFFRTDFTRTVGELKSYRCCFDYEYVLRCIKQGARLHACDFNVSRFRFYRQSKTGSITPVFIREQLEISKSYGRKWHHFLSGFSYLRLLKHYLFPRK